MPSPAVATLTPGQQNAAARALILANAVDRLQQIFTQTVDAASVNGQFAIIPRNVGLIRGFIVDVSATLKNTHASEAAALTNIGAANILRQVSFTDLQNNVRIQTAGWHVHFVNTARAMKPFGIGYTVAPNAPVKYGSNYGEVEAPATIAAASGTGVVTMRYYVPLAYGQTDLRGAVYANVVNATMALGLQLNPNAITATGGDPTLACYLGGTPDPAGYGGIDSVTVTVYQHYLDQLPMTAQGPVLPMTDISTAYELKNTQVSGITANQDFPVSYSNFRTFMSTFALFDNGGVLNAGTDVNYWALESANFTNIWKVSPQENALFSMVQNGVDWPVGAYYFDHRQRPINTSQFGNMQLILNASSASSSPPAQLLMGYEDFSVLNTLSGAGSLAAG